MNAAVVTNYSAPPLELVLATAVVALFVIVPWPVWRVSRNVVTIAHEGGHAIAALLTGRRLTGIRLHSDTSGVTVSVGRPTGPGMVLTMAAGYIAPALVGLGGAVLLAAGEVTVLLWVSLILLAAMLIMIRNPFGVVSIIATGGAIFAVSWFGTPLVQAGFAYLITWFLLLASLRPVVELQRKRRRGGLPYSDADQLARLTRLPGLVWVGLFVVVNAAALAGGGALLLF